MYGVEHVNRPQNAANMSLTLHLSSVLHVKLSLLFTVLSR